jgi:hypothetical protein
LLDWGVAVQKKGIFKYMVCCSLIVSLEPTYAEQLATIEIYKAEVIDVCGARSYASASDCQTLSASRFDELKRKGRLQIRYQRDVVPPEELAFDDLLVGNSRTLSDYASGTSRFAALLVITWAGRSPKMIEVKREDLDGTYPSSVYRRSLPQGRFFYHFPFEQASHIYLTLSSRAPTYLISYHP